MYEANRSLNVCFLEERSGSYKLRLSKKNWFGVLKKIHKEFRITRYVYVYVWIKSSLCNLWNGLSLFITYKETLIRNFKDCGLEDVEFTIRKLFLCKETETLLLSSCSSFSLDNFQHELNTLALFMTHRRKYSYESL